MGIFALTLTSCNSDEGGSLNPAMTATNSISMATNTAVIERAFIKSSGAVENADGVFNCEIFFFVKQSQ